MIKINELHSLEHISDCYYINEKSKIINIKMNYIKNNRDLIYYGRQNGRRETLYLSVSTKKIKSKSKKTLILRENFNAGDRGRTGTRDEPHRILSPGRLPVPPHRLIT